MIVPSVFKFLEWDKVLDNRISGTLVYRAKFNVTRRRKVSGGDIPMLDDIWLPEVVD